MRPHDVEHTSARAQRGASAGLGSVGGPTLSSRLSLLAQTLCRPAVPPLSEMMARAAGSPGSMPRAGRGHRPRVRVNAARILAHATALASLAASASGIGGGLAPHEKLRSWYVAHGPDKDEERLFGYVAGEEAMEPAMTISMRPRASGETSDIMFVRRGNSVGVCNMDDQGLVLSF